MNMEKNEEINQNNPVDVLYFNLTIFLKTVYLFSQHLIKKGIFFTIHHYLISTHNIHSLLIITNYVKTIKIVSLRMS